MPRVWIVWNEERTQGIVLTDEAQVKDLKAGYYTEGDLTEAFVDLYQGETFTVDDVTLSNEGLH